MTLSTTTHLNFRGDAQAALEFYGRVFDGTVSVTTYAQVGMPAEAPGADKVVFGLLVAADGFRLMAYDVPGQPRGPEAVAGSTHRENGATITDRAFFVSLQGDTLDEVAARWALLADGATVIEPLAASPWSAGFGMLTDRFGVTWVVDVRAQHAA
ncbi:VOC family protein [Microbacterium oleivorans]|uniref:VOC family protein n=1 Tax=Microbacterium oleivorans TaxID=273677 RepID=UPI00080EA2C7|nr:VOC family protein [Microbacterium oleivorans]